MSNPPGAIPATATHLVGEIDSQAALLAAARTSAQLAAIGASLEHLGLTAAAHDRQRDGGNMIGQVIEARAPGSGR